MSEKKTMLRNEIKFDLHENSLSKFHNRLSTTAHQTEYSIKCQLPLFCRLITNA